MQARTPCVSRLLFGTLTMGPLQKGFAAEQGAELLCYAAERGVTTVDTAEYYRTYPHIKEALRTYPELSVCTKSYAYSRDGAKRSVELAQEGIGRERIDVFLLHEQESEHTLRGHLQAFAYYLEMRERGVIGRVGISTHHIAAVRAAVEWDGCDLVFAPLNRKGIGIADGSREEMEAALNDAVRHGITTWGMKALGGGHLIPERESALRYMLGLPFLDGIAIGMQSTAEIDVNVALFSGMTPDPVSESVSADALRTLIVENCCTGCGACVKRCGNRALVVCNGHAIVDHTRCVRCAYCAGVCPNFCLKVI